MNQGMACRLSAAIIYSLFVLTFRPALSQVVLSEIMFDPSGSENTDEFVELFNSSPADTADLRGWRLGDGTGDDGLADTGDGFILAPGRYAVILDPDYFGQSASYDSLIPSEAIVLTIEGNTIGSGGLSNTKAETVLIFDAAGKVEDQYSYHTGNRPGYSDERTDLYDSGGPDTWIESKVPFGTPGFRNSAAKVQCNLEILRFYAAESPSGTGFNAVVCNSGKSTVPAFDVLFTVSPGNDCIPDEQEVIGSVLHEETLFPGDSTIISLDWGDFPGIHWVRARVVLDGDEKPEDDILCLRVCFGFPQNVLIINEIMYNPESGEGEWVEIFNPQSDDLCLMNWSISDRDSTRRAEILISSSMIQAGGFYILSNDSFLFRLQPGLSDSYQALPGFPTLNNDSDSVVLYDPSGKLIDRVNYYDRWGGRKGVSLERIDPHRESNHSNNWHPSISPHGASPCEYNSLAPIDFVVENSIHVQPNPFSPDGGGPGEVAAISYHLPFESAYVQLRIFDSRGRAIKHLERGGLCAKAGIYAWDGRDDQDRCMPIGQYIVLLEASEQNGGRTVISRSVFVLARKL